MRRFAYWLFPLIAAAVAIFIVVFMIQINPAPPSAEQCSEDEDAVPCDSNEEVSWIDRFSLKKEKSYFYPINEAHLVLGSSEEVSDRPAYRLSVPLNDSYELFCAKQELANNGAPYLMQTDGNVTILLVDSNDRKKLATLVTKLKTYQISATVSPYTEEQ